MSIQTLDGLTTGRYVVTTHNGTQHVVDLDAKTAVRRGAAGHEWGDKFLHIDQYPAVLPGQNVKALGHFEPITPDGQPFVFDSIQNATVGENMRLDNAVEWRVTSPVRSIEIAP